MFCAAGVALPLVVMGVYAFSLAEDHAASALLTGANLARLVNTLALAGGVLLVVTAVATPMAWLAARTDLPCRTLLSVLAVVPLAIPGYVMAYALRGLGGYGGMLSNWAGAILDPPVGYLGALLCLSAYNLPYMFLTLRAAMFGIDPSLEDAARSLGHGRRRVAIGVVLPQLLPAFLAGALLVLLHVIADFGVVSLMRYETLSYDLFYKLESGHGGARYDASRSGLLLLGLAAVFVAVEMLLLRGLRLDRAGSGGVRPRLSHLSPPARAGGLLLFGVVFLVSVVAPTTSVIYWAVQPDAQQAAGVFAGSGDGALHGLRSALWDSIKCSGPAALLAISLAVPIALLRARYPSKRSFLLERLPYLGYATPALVFALSLILVCLWGLPASLHGVGDALYQSLPLLVYAYALHFLAEAVGPVRSSMYQASHKLEEASYALGRGRVSTFARVTIPLLRQGIVVAAALVFLSCMKELPLTMLLSPSGTQTLAMEIWSYAEEAQYDRVAPYALTIMLFSAGFVGILLKRGRAQAW